MNDIFKKNIKNIIFEIGKWFIVLWKWLNVLYRTVCELEEELHSLPHICVCVFVSLYVCVIMKCLWTSINIKLLINF